MQVLSKPLYYVTTATLLMSQVFHPKNNKLYILQPNRKLILNGVSVKLTKLPCSNCGLPRYELFTGRSCHRGIEKT